MAIIIITIIIKCKKILRRILNRARKLKISLENFDKILENLKNSYPDIVSLLKDLLWLTYFL